MEPRDMRPSRDDLPPGWTDRFWAKAEQRGDCLIWTRGTAGRGYGVHCTKAVEGLKAQDYAHRIAYWLHTGEWPATLHVLHECDTPSCIAPWHLFLGTPLDNMRDCASKGRAARTCRLSEDDVRAIRLGYAAGGTTYQELGDRYGVVFQHVQAIVTGKRWKGYGNV